MEVKEDETEEKRWYIIKKMLSDKSHYLSLPLTFNQLFGESQFDNPYKTKENS